MQEAYIETGFNRFSFEILVSNPLNKYFANGEYNFYDISQKKFFNYAPINNKENEVIEQTLIGTGLNSFDFLKLIYDKEDFFVKLIKIRGGYNIEEKIGFYTLDTNSSNNYFEKESYNLDDLLKNFENKDFKKLNNIITIDEFKEKINKFIEYKQQNNVIMHVLFYEQILPVRMFAPKTSRMKSIILVKILSPLLIIIDEISWTYDIPFGESFHVHNQMKIHTEIDYNNENDNLVFKLYLSSSFDLKFYKQCLIENYILSETKKEVLISLNKNTLPLFKQLSDEYISN